MPKRSSFWTHSNIDGRWLLAAAARGRYQGIVTPQPEHCPTIMAKQSNTRENAPGMLAHPRSARVRLVSFIVPAWNEEDLLGHTLEALLKAAEALGLPYE